MKRLTKPIALLIFAILSMAAMTTQAQITKGEKSFGPKVGYISKNTSAVAGLVFRYSFSDHIRIAPELSYTFKHNDLDAFMFDLNVNIPFGIIGAERVALYPLAGMNYSSWNRHTDKTQQELDDDVSTRRNRFGLNLGAGFELKCSETVKLNLEAKYCFIKGYSSTMITLGFGYIF